MEKTFFQDLNLYVIETDKGNPNHQDYMVTLAPHLITVAPNTGDKILGVLRGKVIEIWKYSQRENKLYCSLRTARLITRDYTKHLSLSSEVYITLKAYSGEKIRSDKQGKENVTDITDQVFLDMVKQLTGLPGGASWHYFPVEAQFTQLKDILEKHESKWKRRKSTIIWDHNFSKGLWEKGYVLNEEEDVTLFPGSERIEVEDRVNLIEDAEFDAMFDDDDLDIDSLSN